ncbi:hypothetical protein [Coleofasciculus sp. E1-EBD-02]|uniref:hypothetical protein n=1 Tax=Coleofasciculus sp. E1-EBD-02 TaxID=3068481 RepID=UPI0032FE0283
MNIENLLKFGILGVTSIAAISIVVLLVEKSETENRQNIDGFVERAMAESLARKLNKSESTVLEVLQGSSNPEIVAQIEELISSVQLLFRKQPKSTNVEIRLEVNYTDETYFATTINRSWDEIPGNVREQFIRTGSHEAILPWNFLWDIETK